MPINWRLERFVLSILIHFFQVVNSIQKDQFRTPHIQESLAKQEKKIVKKLLTKLHGYILNSLTFYNEQVLINLIITQTIGLLL